MKVDTEFLSKLVGKAFSVAKDGEKLTYSDPNEIYQYVFATLAVAADFIPGGGPALSGFLGLLGAVVFPLSTTDTWLKISEKVEQLVGSKISDYHLKVLKAKIEGFDTNMSAFTKVLDQYNKASPDTKERQGEILRDHHIAFLTVMRTSIPEFQIEEFAVQALPLFALAANVHVSLLAQGIKSGLDWGYTKDYVEGSLRPEFTNAVGGGAKPKKFRIRGSQPESDESNEIEARQDDDELRQLLEKAIKDGEDNGWAADLLDTWKLALNELGVQRRSIAARANTNYRGFVDDIYAKGRTEVKEYQPEIYEPGNPGITAASALRTYADYDAQMIQHVLSYAEFWPYLAGGAPVPPEVGQRLDREIFSGPYGRYTTDTKWTKTTPPPVTGRNPDDKISSISVRAYDDIDMFQVKYGTKWGQRYGDINGGIPYSFDLAANETIQTVQVAYGHKLGQLKFITTDNSYGPWGAAKHGSGYGGWASHSGYALTSAWVTNWSRGTPPGCEGIVLGFRPLAFISS